MERTHLAIAMAILVASTAGSAVRPAWAMASTANPRTQASALARDPRARAVLDGDCYEVVDGIRTDARRGSVAAMELLAEVYYRGECGVAQDQRHAGAIDKSILHLRPSDSEANGFLARVGDGRPKSIRDAIAYYRVAQREHDPFATTNLSEVLSYSNDRALGKEALSWTRVAAAEGDLVADVAMAEYHLYGFGGVPIDRQRGLRMLRQADIANNAQAARELGIAYRDGVGVTADPRQAETYFKRSIQLGNAYAGLLLAREYAMTRDVDAARAESVHYAEEAMARLYDDPDVTSQIGYIYMSDVGVPTDFPKAARLLEKAAGEESTMAMDGLAYLKLNGLGVPMDFRGAVRLLARSAADGDAFAKGELSDMQIQADRNARISESNMDAAQSYWRMSMQRQANQNQMPIPGSPAYETIHPTEPEPEPEYGEGNQRQ